MHNLVFLFHNRNIFKRHQRKDSTWLNTVLIKKKYNKIPNDNLYLIKALQMGGEGGVWILQHKENEGIWIILPNLSQKHSEKKERRQKVGLTKWPVSHEISFCGTKITDQFHGHSFLREYSSSRSLQSSKSKVSTSTPPPFTNRKQVQTTDL